MATCKELFDQRTRLQARLQGAHTDADRQAILDQISDVDAQIEAQGCAETAPPPPPASSDPCADVRSRYLELTNELRRVEHIGPPLQQVRPFAGGGDASGDGPDEATAWHRLHDAEYSRLETTLKALNCQGPPTITFSLNGCQSQADLQQIRDVLEENRVQLRMDLQQGLQKVVPNFMLSTDFFPQEGIAVQCVDNQSVGGIWGVLVAAPLTPHPVGGLAHLGDFLPTNTDAFLVIKLAPELFAYLNDIFTTTIPGGRDGAGNQNSNGPIFLRWTSLTIEGNQIVFRIEGLADTPEGSVTFTFVSTDTLSVSDADNRVHNDNQRHLEINSVSPPPDLETALQFVLGPLADIPWIEISVGPPSQTNKIQNIGDIIAQNLPRQLNQFPLRYTKILVDSINGVVASAQIGT